MLGENYIKDLKKWIDDNANLVNNAPNIVMENIEEEIEEKKKEWISYLYSDDSQPFDFVIQEEKFTKWVEKSLIEIATLAKHQERRRFIETLKELRMEEKAFEVRKDNEQYSLGQTNGYSIATREHNEKIDKKIEELSS